MTLYKFTAEGGQSPYGHGVWTPGKWRTVTPPLVACSHGIHYVKGRNFTPWLNAELWTFEDYGDTLDADDKLVTTRGRILELVDGWNNVTARLFAADCAENVVHLIPESHREPFTVAISVARRYAHGDATDEERDAARAAAAAAAAAAAWAAAGDAAAAWDRAAAAAAARDAAWAAAAAAAGDAAWAAARDAAWDAAGDAAWAAAWAAAWERQNDRLIAMLSLTPVSS